MNMSKNDNLSELDRKIKYILFYKKKIHRNSTCSKIMEMLYPDIRFTVSQIASKISKPHLYTKKIVLQMHSDGYLFHDEKKYNRASSTFLTLSIPISASSLGVVSVLSQ